MGTMPPTALLLVEGNNLVVGHFASYTEIGMYLGISCDDNGVIHFRGEPQNPSYVLETDPKLQHPGHGFTKMSAIRDWCRCYMQKNLRDHIIYRYLK